MSNIIPFFYNAKQVRAIIKDGEPWFVVKDVCEILEINNPNMAAARLDDDEVSQTEVIDNLGRKQMTNIVNEPGLYNLILRSDKPEAKRFKRWITHEVIPSIRKHGAYMTPETIEKVLSDPDTIIRLATALKEERQRRLELEPKADQFDKFISGENYQDMNTAAKVLGWGRNKLFAELRQRKILMSDNRPYQRYIDAGYFVVKEKPIQMGGQVINKPQTYVTAKGVSWLEKLLSKEGALV